MANFEGTHASHTQLGEGARASILASYPNENDKTKQQNYRSYAVALTTESGRSRASSGSGQGDRERERTRIGSTCLLIAACVRCHSTHRTEAPAHTRILYFVWNEAAHEFRQVYRSPDGFPLSAFPHPFSIRRCIRFILVDDDFIPAAIATHLPFRMWISAAAAAFGSHCLFIRATRMRRNTKHKISQKNEETNICFVHFDILIFVFFLCKRNAQPHIESGIERKKFDPMSFENLVILIKAQ